MSRAGGVKNWTQEGDNYNANFVEAFNDGILGKLYVKLA